MPKEPLKIKIGKVTFSTFAGTDKKWRWRAMAKNGRKLATSGESLASRGNAERALIGLLRAMGHDV